MWLAAALLCRCTVFTHPVAVSQPMAVPMRLSVSALSRVLAQLKDFFGMLRVKWWCAVVRSRREAIAVVYADARRRRKTTRSSHRFVRSRAVLSSHVLPQPHRGLWFWRAHAKQRAFVLP